MDSRAWTRQSPLRLLQIGYTQLQDEWTEIWLDTNSVKKISDFLEMRMEMRSSFWSETDSVKMVFIGDQNHGDIANTSPIPAGIMGFPGGNTTLEIDVYDTDSQILYRQWSYEI